MIFKVIKQNQMFSLLFFSFYSFKSFADILKVLTSR